MNRTVLSLLLVAAGVVLLIFGFSASDSFASEVKEAFDGTPTDKSIWLLVGGVLCCVAGGATLLLRRPAT
ncbi:MAG: DUF3185 family protein [Planctomycetes bacterium]|nr:DUF3185 family protein [Planctomycetota bacterium]